MDQLKDGGKHIINSKLNHYHQNIYHSLHVMKHFGKKKIIKEKQLFYKTC